MKVSLILVVSCLYGILMELQDPINVEYIDYLKKTVSWEVEDYEKNIFKGWSHQELKKLLGDIYTSNADNDEDDGELELEALDPKKLEPESMAFQQDVVDWSLHKCTHRIVVQGQCGGCWAFTIAGIVSDRCCLKGVDYGWLSTQELISCDKKNFGCDEGSRETGINYVKENGLVPASCYPYAERDEDCPTACRDGSDWAAAHVCKCKKIKKCTGEKKLMKCLQSGPVAGGMAVYVDFLYYKGGIYSWNRLAELMGYHSVRIVGYGPGYWKCANSWGENWGMQGYFLIAKGECDLEARAPIICDPIP